jgi:hypothetical protein
VTLAIANVTFACDDPEALAAFWAAALGYEQEPAPPEVLEAMRERGEDPNQAAAARDPSGRGPRLFFEKKRKRTGEPLPIHLDLACATDIEAEAVRLEALGATRVARKSQSFGSFTAEWIVMKDPEGNGFCVQG